MKDTRFHPVVRQTLGIVCALLALVFPVGSLFAQQPAPPAQPSPAVQQFSPEQLDNLVAPIALYPDGLLSQVLVATTYPLEMVEAAQWLQQNRNLQGQQLVDAARQQNWDPSIQALVVFPDVVSRLSSDIRWTTDLGNAFLAQQADVMNAVQRMRARARAAGKLNSNAQETVTTQTQGDRTAIDIQPADPQVVYVPEYNPEYIWGPPAYGYYPPLYYPDFGYGFGSARAFTSEASSAVWDGAVGAGGRTGSTTRFFRTTPSSITMVLMAFMAAEGLAAVGSGRTIQCTGWGWHTPIEGWPPVTAVRAPMPRCAALRPAE